MRSPKKKKDKKTRSPMLQSARCEEQPAMASSNDGVKVLPTTPPNPIGTATSQKKCQHNNGGDNNGGCKGSPTGVLTASEIKKYGILVKEDFHESCLQVTSYDLRLGEGHMVYEADKKKWSAQWVSPDLIHPDHKNPPFEPIGDKLVIPRYGMALIQLRETVDLRSCMENKDNPVMICGHFDLKLSRVKEGLISQQATQVEPGYRGKLFCYLFNQSGEDIYLSYTDINNAKVATIEFQYVSCVSQCDERTKHQLLEELEKEHEKYLVSPFCTDHGIMDVRFFDGSLPEKAGLSVISNRLDGAHEEARNGLATEIRNLKTSITFYNNWNVRLAAFLFALLGLIIANAPIQAGLIQVWTKINEIRIELENVKAEGNTARDSLITLREEAQEAYKMAKSELDELDRKKKELLLKNKSKIVETPVVSNTELGKGGNQ